MPGLLAFVGGGLLEGVGKGLVLSGQEKREAALKRIEDERQQKGRLELEEVKHKNRGLLKTEDRAAQQKNALELKLAPGAPTLPSGYQRTEGGLEFTPGGPADPMQVGALAKAKAKGGGGLTVAQQRENAEIQQAREALDREGLSHEDVMRISKSQRDTGRDNPEYSPFINSRVRQATRRKYGEDPDFAATYGRYLTPGPEFSDPAGPKALPPGVSAEEPGFLDQARDFLGFGGDEGEASAESPRASYPRYRPPAGAREETGTSRIPTSPRARLGRRAQKPIPSMSLTEIDDLMNSKGDSLSPAELKAIQARLTELGM